MFDYRVPPHLAGTLVPGHQVRVPFGRQTCAGYVIEVQQALLDESQQGRLKDIASVLDGQPLLADDLLPLVDWLCWRYACTRLEAIEAMLPSVLRKDTIAERTTSHLLPAASQDILRAALAARQPHRQRQAALLHDLLAVADQTAPAGIAVRPSDPAVRALVRDGLAQVVEARVARVPRHMVMPEEPRDRPLTQHQLRAYETVREALAHPAGDQFVLFGVTGSGKTEVYLRLIEAALTGGGGAIVLVPEIALTPQLVGRFQARFGPLVAVLHSALTGGEKHDEWKRVRSGAAQIVIGARSAVFAPVRDLRVIIIDEEHETSFKQEENPRYDAREVAFRRMEQASGVVVCGSATPSLQSMQAVDTGRARLLALPFRVHGRPLPPVDIVDMREELREGNRSVFSRALADGLERSLRNGEQAVLFLNRRGYSAFVLCRSCGEPFTCPHCDISLTLHRDAGRQFLSCHYCNHRTPLPEACPRCGEEALRPYGIGTQQVEQALLQRWPDWRVLRMDVDTTRRRGAHTEALEAFAERKADILLGTQMVAKGLDFPDVTFVGVIAADTMLSVPDYRSAERTFSLLTQVAGRAGRSDADGHTVIQTYRPEHYAIRCAARHDYQGFYRQERALRETFHYPPFCELGVFVATHTEERLARGAAQRYERELRRTLTAADVTVLSAVPTGVRRVEDRFRYQVVVKYSQWADVRAAITTAYEAVATKMRELGGFCTLDVNAGRF